MPIPTITTPPANPSLYTANTKEWDAALQGRFDWQVTETAERINLRDWVESSTNKILAVSDASTEVQTQGNQALASSQLASTYSTKAQALLNASGNPLAPLALSDIIDSGTPQLIHNSSAIKTIIYDTSKDSDGGAWRKRCTDKSWYNEVLGGDRYLGQQASVAAAWTASNSFAGGMFLASATNGAITSGKFYKVLTSTTVQEVYRGITREFPAVVAIVAEASRVVIYDLTFSSCPMWMVFKGATTSITHIGYDIGGRTLTSLAALNGVLVVAAGTGASSVIYFVADYAAFRSSTNSGRMSLNISQRNLVNATDGSLVNITNPIVNDVAITALDTAPIDPAIGLPVPTIYVFTAGGVSRIADDGTVTSTATGATVSSGGIRGKYITAINSSIAAAHPLISTLPTGGGSNLSNYWSGLAYYWTTASIPATNGVPTKVEANAIGSASAMMLLKENPTTPTKSMVTYITNTYNSGWQVGDSRGAYLADTTAETITDGTSELVTNGTFTTDTSGWTADYATLSSVSGALRITATSASNDAAAFQSISGLIVGRTYSVSLTFSAGTTGSGSIALSTGAIYSSDYGFYDLSAGVPAITFKATGTTLGIALLNQSNTVGTYSIFDNVSCKMVNELVTNGTFTTNTSGWTATNATLAVVGSELQITTNGLNATASQTITGLIVGRSYYRTLTGRRGTCTSSLVYNGVTFNATTSNVTVNDTFIATATSLSVTLIVLGTETGTTAFFDNISVKLAEPDRSVKNTGLVLNGTLTKTAVATGAGLVAYSGFSGSNYLEQPYSANLDFGTGDFCVMGWVNYGGINQTFVERYSSGSTGRITFGTTGLSAIYYSCSATGAVVTTSYTLLAGLHFISIKRLSGTVIIEVDGASVYSLANTENITNTAAKLEIGIGVALGNPASSSTMALWRISATAPTADQIAHIYRTELPLFQAGAQCTLAGTSTAVTALAYDESTDILHAGTSWGRSEFKNLLRVQSEATSVGTITSLSAVSGTIAQCGTSTKVSTKQLSIRDSLLSKEQEQKAKVTTKVIDYTAITSQTAFVLQKGWTVKRLYKNGTRVRESTTGSYFTRSNDGFQETATLSTACTAGDWISIHQERKLNV
jgi:hypothetical protein